MGHVVAGLCWPGLGGLTAPKSLAERLIFYW
jgi:hypothetical protein